MKPILLIDFGSTNTKVTAVDVDSGRLLGTAASFTTVQTDIGDGLKDALLALEQSCGKLDFSQRFACSSAAGGLKMVASGLVPSLTAEAARLASLGAGAKIAKTYSYQLTDEDIAEIDRIKPDIFLLTGGVDGGNTECILHNSRMLATCKADFPVLLAGNRVAAARCEELLVGRDVIRCPNVMPKLNELDIEPVQQQIRKLFLERIIQAKGLSRESQLISGIMMPTPSAVKRAMELLAEGVKGQGGIGELVAVDLGGATTDVYSVAEGLPERDDIILKGFMEPYSKRTVEGDIGMRYSAHGVLLAVGAEKLSLLSGLDEQTMEAEVAALAANPGRLPQSECDHALDFAIAAAAVETAVARHAGTMEQVYTIAGPALAQSGKDLRRVKSLILTGGAVIHNSRAGEIGGFAKYSAKAPMSLRPQEPNVLVDRSYILSAMGLLAEAYPQIALSIIKKELVSYGLDQ